MTSVAAVVMCNLVVAYQRSTTRLKEQPIGCSSARRASHTPTTSYRLPRATYRLLESTV